MKTSDSTNKILAQEVDPAFAKRSRHIVAAIKKAKPKKVLDAGCGRGFYVKIFTYLPFIKEIRGIDISEAYLSKARAITQSDKRVTLTKASMYKLPFEDNYFDCVVCSEVLEHLEKDSDAVGELYRVLKPKGMLLVTVPHARFPFLWDPLNWILMKIFRTHVNKNIWWLAGIWADHERLYQKNELKKLLSKNKFEVKPIRGVVNWSWPFSHFLLYAIGKNLVERAGNKAFDRFNFNQDRPLSRLLARVMAFPSRLLDRSLNTGASVDLFVEARKS